MSKKNRNSQGPAVSASTAAPDKLRGLRECAAEWGVDRNLLSRLLNQGKIGYVRPGRERRIPDSEMAKWVANNLIRDRAA